MTDPQRISLRPTLPLEPGSTAEERFQNETLRPILKAQHGLLRAAFGMFLTKRKVRPEQLPVAERNAKVKELVTRDNRLRGLLFGMIAGLFTAAEMDYYVHHESAVNRRITNLLVERLT